MAKGHAVPTCDSYRDVLLPLWKVKVSLNSRLAPELHQRLRCVARLTDVPIQRIVEETVRAHPDRMA